jgi:hypothetical protein
VREPSVAWLSFYEKIFFLRSFYFGCNTFACYVSVRIFVRAPFRERRVSMYLDFNGALEVLAVAFVMVVVVGGCFMAMSYIQEKKASVGRLAMT